MAKERRKYNRFFSRREYAITSLSELNDSIKLDADRKWFDKTLIHELKENGLTDQEIIRLFYF